MHNLGTTGTNGSGAIGAVGFGSAASGSPAATVTTARNNSLVFGVGNSSFSFLANPVPPIPDANQVLIHQLLDPGCVDSPGCQAHSAVAFWAQQVATNIAMSGTVVTFGDASPSSDPYDLSVVAIQPPVAASTAPLITSLSAISGAPGMLVIVKGLNFGALQGASTINFNGTTATPSSWSANSIVVPVPAGASSGDVVLTVGGQSSNGLRFLVVNAAGLAVDRIVSADFQSILSGNTPPFSTTSGNEVLLAFVSGGSRFSPPQIGSISGAGLTWSLVQRTNTQQGTAEIWQTYSPFILGNATVTLGVFGDASVTVISYLGADTTGTNGSAAIGAVGTSNAASGPPSASLTTTRANSMVFGVGNDPAASTARTLGANQTLVAQFVGPCAFPGCTFWVQQAGGSIANSGTVVTVNDTAPTADPYNLSIVEVRPPANSPLTISAVAAPAANAAGWNNSNVTITYTCAGGVAPVQCPGPQTVSAEGAN